MKFSVFLALATLAVALMTMTGCEPMAEAKPGLSCGTFFDGRVIVEFKTRTLGATPNFEPEYMTYRFNDIGEYKILFHVPDDYRGDAWKTPEDFSITINSGAREIIKKFDALLGMSPVFSMTITRNGESQSCRYSVLD